MTMPPDVAAFVAEHRLELLSQSEIARGVTVSGAELLGIVGLRSRTAILLVHVQERDGVEHSRVLCARVFHGRAACWRVWARDLDGVVSLLSLAQLRIEERRAGNAHRRGQR